MRRHGLGGFSSGAARAGARLVTLAPLPAIRLMVRLIGADEAGTARIPREHWRADYQDRRQRHADRVRLAGERGAMRDRAERNAGNATAGARRAPNRAWT